MGLDGGFLHNLINEISALAVGTRVDKIFQPSREELILNLRNPGFSKKLLISARNGSARIGFINAAPENPLVAPMFCMLLRKYIGGARIKEISQIGFERVVKFTFESRNEMGDTIYPQLYVELITGSPNIIFVDNDGIILDSTRRSDVEKNTRMIQPGAKYTLPTSLDKIDLTEENMGIAIAKVKENSYLKIWEAIISSISGVSPLVAREIALMCNRDLDATGENIKEKMLKWGLESLYKAQQNGTPYTLYKEGKPYDFSYLPINQYGDAVKLEKQESFSNLLENFYSSKDNQDRIRRQSQDILKLLTNLETRISRKINARKKDLKKCENREKYRIYGELIKANIYAISRGDNVARVINYYDENGGEIDIPLDIKLSPADNAQKYFKEYKKLCVAEKTLQELIDDANSELEYINSVFENLSKAENSADLSALKEELIGQGYIKAKPVKNQKRTSSKPMKFISTDGFTIYVGKNNIQNDQLTLKTAVKSDLWFHTKNIHGSHVILSLEGKEATDTAVLEAATLAAYYSKAKNSSSVPVDYTPVKFVKKPTGARPGMVIYSTNQTIFVTPTEETITNLKG